MKKILFITFLVTLSLSKGLAQNHARSADGYAPKKFYLVDSLELAGLTKEDRQLIDSCLKVYHKAKEDTSKINALSFICENMVDESWHKYQFFQYKLIEKKLTTNPPTLVTKALRKALATSLNNIGYIYMNQGDIPKALGYIHKSLKIQEEIGNKQGISYSFNNLGGIYHQQGDLLKAMEYFAKSLKIQEEIGDKHGLAISLNSIGTIYNSQGKISKALEYFAKSLKIREEIGDKKGMANCLNNIGYIYDNQGNLLKALEYHTKSLKVRKKIGDKHGLAVSLNNIGDIYNNQGDIPKALEYHINSLKIREEIEDKHGIAESLNNIGFIYDSQHDFLKALEYYTKSLKIREEIGDKQGVANSINNIADIYNNQGDVTKALESHIKSLIIREEIGDKQGIAASLNNIGNIYQHQGNLSEALEYDTKSLKIREEIGDKMGIAYSLNDIGNVYLIQQKPANAKSYLERSYQLSKELGYPDNIKIAASGLRKVYEKLGNYKLAYYYYQEEILMRDSIQSEKNYKTSVQQQSKYEYEKQKAIDDAQHEKLVAIEQEAKAKQKVITYATAGGLGLVAIFLIFVFNRLQVTKKQKHIIEQQKHIVEEKHKEITDSINYAERIQRSFLATTEMLDKYLNPKPVIASCHPELSLYRACRDIEGTAKQSHSNKQIASLPTVVRNDERNYFVFFRPKDVVSGDFYWAGELNNGNFAFSCADSTGHGVPGAIMSILNISSLEKSIEKETEPNQILNQTRKIIIDRLKKDGSPEGGKDGMDCSLLVINQDRTQLSFAAANNPVFILRPTVIASCHPEPVEGTAKQSVKNEQIASLPTVVRNDDGEEKIVHNDGYELIEFKPDKMPVGKHDNDTQSFTLHTALLQKGDVIYALTDGFSDQFGGDKGKKYMIKNLKELLLQIAHLPMLEQEQKLADEFDKWKGSNEQVDDVCIIGVRI